MPETHVLTAIVPEANAGCRLDQAAAVLFPQFSRSRLKRWILDGRLTVACGDGALRLLGLQPAGKTAMAAESFLRGRAVPRGTVLG